MANGSSWLKGLVLALGLATFGHADELADPWIRGVFTGKCALSNGRAGDRRAWKTRKPFSRPHVTKAFVLVGTGDSMQPLYAPGTILVLQHCAYEKLERGQTAAHGVSPAGSWRTCSWPRRATAGAPPG